MNLNIKSKDRPSGDEHDARFGYATAQTLTRYPKFAMSVSAAKKVLRSSKDTIRFHGPEHFFLQYAPDVKVRDAWRALSFNHFFFTL
jgi:hypothetical protein